VTRTIADFLLYCTIQNAAGSGQLFSRVATMLALVDEIVGGREPTEAGTVSRSHDDGLVSYKMKYDTHRSLFQPSILTDRLSIDCNRSAE
jgi:hypothetical protein